MATTRKITAPVGIRNGNVVMPNRPVDLATITDLFDSIPTANGGSAEIAGVWPTDRDLLIADVTAQIVTFQTFNRRPVVDGVVDPNGGSLRLMNQLAQDPPAGAITATVAAPPGSYPTEVGPVGIYVVNVSSMPGAGALSPTVANTAYSRRLVRVENSSINWFGVVVPQSVDGGTLGSKPHIHFTPTPNQGGYYDGAYDSFTAWGKLWADYTSTIGGQMVAAGVNQVLVIPFYRNSQQRDLGDFLSNWRDVVAAVVTAAVISIDPFRLRDTYTFDRIVSSSFSNGFVVHQQFNTRATGADDATDVLFDLDGVAGGSHWQPAKGVIYLNRPAPRVNPAGQQWFVGGRWAKFTQIYSATTHAFCRNHLLYHGLWQYCS